MFTMFTIFKEISMKVAVVGCLDSIGKQILREIKPYHIKFFVNKNEQINAIKEHSVIQHIAQGIPSILIDLKKFIIYNEQQFINSSTYNNANYIQSFDVMINYEFYDVLEESRLSDLENIIHNISELSSVKLTRPKCLLIRINDKSTVNNYSNDLLKYASGKKLLDFSVIEVELDRCIMKSYNPFYNIFMEKSFNSIVPFKIFTDKLSNINGYKLKVGVISSDLHIKSFYGITYILKQSNFSVISYELGTSDPETYE